MRYKFSKFSLLCEEVQKKLTVPIQTGNDETEVTFQINKDKSALASFQVNDNGVPVPINVNITNIDDISSINNSKVKRKIGTTEEQVQASEFKKLHNTEFNLFEQAFQKITEELRKQEENRKKEQEQNKKSDGDIKTEDVPEININPCGDQNNSDQFTITQDGYTFKFTRASDTINTGNEDLDGQEQDNSEIEQNAFSGIIHAQFTVDDNNKKMLAIAAIKIENTSSGIMNIKLYKPSAFQNSEDVESNKIKADKTFIGQTFKENYKKEYNALVTAISKAKEYFEKQND